MTFDNETIKELTSVLPEKFRELRPEGKAWTVSKAAYIREIRQMMVFHLDCKKLILRVWMLSWKKFHDLDPKHGSIKDYIIRYIKPTQIIQGKENNTIPSRRCQCFSWIRQETMSSICYILRARI